MKKAFTLIELIFVIIVIGILSAIALPKMGGGKLRKAADQVVSHIRYTQHLAMVDDKFDTAESDWFKARWQVLFQDDTSSTDKVYTIYTDKGLDGGAPANGEIALDPLTKRQMTGINNYNNRTAGMNLSNNFSITNVDVSSCASGAQRIFFDHLGRPHTNVNNGVYNDLLTTQCEIILFNSEGNVSIFIEPETGYVHL